MRTYGPVLFVFGIVCAIAAVLVVVVPRNDEEPVRPRVSDHEEAIPSTPTQRDPTFRVGSDLELAAQRAVYERCSRQHFAWREGARMTATTVYKRTPDQPDRVNVSADLPSKERVANGHTLWYMITFDGKLPVEITANKDVSARFCNLDSAERTFPL